MAYRYLIYSTGTTFSATIKRESATSGTTGLNEAELYSNFIIPEIQPSYLWQVSGGTVIPNTEANINAYETSIAPPPESKDNITYGEVTGITDTKIDKVPTAIPGNFPIFVAGGNVEDSGWSADDIITAGSGVSQTQFNIYSGATKLVIDSKLATALFEAYSGATKTIIDSKLATALFQAYSGVTDTFIKTKLNITDFNVYSGATKTVIDSKLATALFQAYSGVTDTFIKTKLTTALFEAYSGATKTIIDSKLATALFQAYSGVTDTFIKTKLATALFEAYSGATKTVIDSKLATALFEAYSGATKTVIDSKLATALFQAYSATTDTFIKTKLNITDFNVYSGATKTIIDSKLATALFQAYSATTDTFIKTKLDKSEFTGYTESIKNIDKKIQVVSTSTANANTVAVTKITWNTAPISADTYLFSGGTAVWIKSPGTYEAQYHVLLKNDAANQTHSLGGSLLKNGATLPLASSAGMIIGPNMSGELSLPSTIFTADANDRLDLAVFRIGNTGNANLVNGFVHLTLNKLTN